MWHFAGVAGACGEEKSFDHLVPALNTIFWIKDCEDDECSRTTHTTHHTSHLPVRMAFQAVEGENVIKPEAKAPSMDTSDLPLLLKDFSKRAFFAVATATTNALT